MFAANVRAPFYLVAAFAPGMAAREGQHHQHQQYGGPSRPTAGGLRATKAAWSP